MNARQFLVWLVFLHLLFTPWAWRCPGVYAFHPFESENSAGRIKIKLLGRILLHGSSPDFLVCLDY